jgi:hypothetical protein
MESKIVLLLFVVLLGVYFFVFNNAILHNKDSFRVEKFQSELNEDHDIIDDESESEDEDEDDEEDENEESATVPVSDTIEIRDTVRRDSKVDSSLSYVYVDEQCGKIVKPVENDYIEDQFTVENFGKMGPGTPIILGNTNDSVVMARLEKDTEREKCPPCNLTIKTGDVKSEMWDDADLKPKPEINSPYGFVYFPNKYWKMWHQKAPVCTPVNGACKVLPTYTEGTPVNVLDYTQIGSIMPKFEYKEEHECE